MGGDSTDDEFLSKDQQVQNFAASADRKQSQHALELRLLELRKNLAATPASRPMDRKFLEIRVQNLENEVRAAFGTKSLAQQSIEEDVKARAEEKKNGKGIPELQKVPDGTTRDGQQGRPGLFAKPPIVGLPRRANTGIAEEPIRGNGAGQQVMPPQQDISYDGFTMHFGVVPVTDEMRRSLNRIHEGVARAKAKLIGDGKKLMADKLCAFEATYTKAYLERSRLPAAIQLVRRARARGWRVVLLSETISGDPFRRTTAPDEDSKEYQGLDVEMGGELSKIMPPYSCLLHELQNTFGSEIAGFEAADDTDPQRQVANTAFTKERPPILLTTFAAERSGSGLHDEDGDKPRISIFLGQPFSGALLERSISCIWRFGVKSDARAVLLVTDAELDVRLLVKRVGPRMRALGACVLGERASSVTSRGIHQHEENQEQEEILAYDRGGEVKLNAQSFLVRSKSRNVDMDNWSAITFPSSEVAKNRGIRIDLSGAVKDGQRKPRSDKQRATGFYRPPTLGDIRARRKVDENAQTVVTEQMSLSEKQAKVTQERDTNENNEKRSSGREEGGALDDSTVKSMTSPKASGDPPSKIYENLTQEAKSYIRQRTKDADQKAMFFIAAFVSILAHSLNRTLPYRWIKSLSLWSFADYLGLICTCALAFAITTLLRVLLTSLGDSASALRFLDAITQPDIGTEKGIETLDIAKDPLRDVLFQEFRELTTICDEKFRLLRVSFWVGWIAALVEIAALIFTRKSGFLYLR